MLMILELIQAIKNDNEREVVERIFHQYYKFMMAKAVAMILKRVFIFIYLFQKIYRAKQGTPFTRFI